MNKILYLVKNDKEKKKKEETKKMNLIRRNKKVNQYIVENFLENILWVKNP